MKVFKEAVGMWLEKLIAKSNLSTNSGMLARHKAAITATETPFTVQVCVVFSPTCCTFATDSEKRFLTIVR